MNNTEALTIFHTIQKCRHQALHTNDCGNCERCQYRLEQEQIDGAVALAISALEKQEADRWIPVTERLPETTDPVNVTWTNNDPVSYYEDIRGKRFTATAHYHREKWWWYSAVCQDLLDEYGKSCMGDEIDKAVEILAWRPLPEPYTEEEE